MLDSKIDGVSSLINIVQFCEQWCILFGLNFMWLSACVGNFRIRSNNQSIMLSKTICYCASLGALWSYMGGGACYDKDIEARCQVVRPQPT